MAEPIRIQRSRQKGARLVSPNGLPIIYVGRGSKWGNPHIPQSLGGGGRYRPGGREAEYRKRCFQCVEMFRSDLVNGRLLFTVEDVRRELRGKNLVCWCPLTDGHGQRYECHADVLLEIASTEE